MLESLKKKLGIVPNVEAKEAVTDKLEVSLSVTDTEEYKELLQGFTEQSALLDASQSEVSKLKAEVDSLKVQMQQFAEAKVDAEAKAKQMKMDARKASLAKDVGDVRAAAVLAATEGLDDTQFEAIASALKLSVETEAQNMMFNEQGVEGNVKPAASANGERVETAEGKALKAKYQRNK
jgi:hypothetical protein